MHPQNIPSSMEDCGKNKPAERQTKPNQIKTHSKSKEQSEMVRKRIGISPETKVRDENIYGMKQMKSGKTNDVFMSLFSIIIIILLLLLLLLYVHPNLLFFSCLNGRQIYHLFQSLQNPQFPKP
ncbi:hypothetical protein QVD17_14520 [Tagetes erecta]|uniref:Uncharacterized protein n=1 Tax=Tagetes erecta TaxID=13708 RepID=A0AAD8NWV1_TARER|nr:hypothetical protein QVD17_14520 [Tagetes erecta]